jgi:hypothetical protein
VTTRATVSAGVAGVPGGRVLSRNSPAGPSSANRCCHRQTAGPFRHRQHRQTIRRQQHDPSPQHMLMRAVAIADDRDKLRAILNIEQDAHRLRHNRRFAQAVAFVNRASRSMH